MVSFVIVSVSMVFTVRVVRSTEEVVVEAEVDADVVMVMMSWNVRVGRTSLITSLVAESVVLMDVSTSVAVIAAVVVDVTVSGLETVTEVSVDTTAVVEVELSVSVKFIVSLDVVVSTEAVLVMVAMF